VKKWSRNEDLNAGAAEPGLAAVVAAYNRPRELRLALEGYRRQSFFRNHHQEFQLILADDGSGPEVERTFSEFSDQVSFPTLYLRQEDRGWGKLRMLNRAVLECRADRVVFADADCIPHRHFLLSHFQDCGEDAVACGRRVDLTESVSRALTAEDVRGGAVESWTWLARNALKRSVDYGEQGFYLPRPIARALNAFSRNRKPTLIGSNFSISRKRLWELNGFDETFTMPGFGEDTDLERRIGQTGLKIEWITYRAIQFHLWHPLTPVGDDALRLAEDLKRKGNGAALKGLRELEKEIAGEPADRRG